MVAECFILGARIFDGLILREFVGKLILMLVLIFNYAQLFL